MWDPDGRFSFARALKTGGKINNKESQGAFGKSMSKSWNYTRDICTAASDHQCNQNHQNLSFLHHVLSIDGDEFASNDAKSETLSVIKIQP